MWLKSKKINRTVVLIKQGDEIYLVRSRLFTRCFGWIQDDYNCPRSKHHDLVKKVASDLITVSTGAVAPAPVRCSERPFMVYDVALTGKSKRFDLSVYFMHIAEYHRIVLNDHCVLLCDHPLDTLLRKRAEQSTIEPAAKKASVAA